MANRKGSVFALEERRHSPHGLRATVLGGLSFIALCALTLISILGGGQIGYWAGAVGVTAFIIAFCGMLIGFKSFSDTCRSYLLSKIGTLLCGSMVAAWFLICCVGLAN